MKDLINYFLVTVILFLGYVLSCHADEYLIFTIDQRAKESTINKFQRDCKDLYNDTSEIDVLQLPTWRLAINHTVLVWVCSADYRNITKMGKNPSVIKEDKVKEPKPFDKKDKEDDYIQWFYAIDIESVLRSLGLEPVVVEIVEIQ